MDVFHQTVAHLKPVLALLGGGGLLLRKHGPSPSYGLRHGVIHLSL